MDKNLQNTDDIFKKAYQQYEEKPSADAWEKLNALLDKENKPQYKKRVIGWKLIAAMLLLLSGGIVFIYEFRKSKSENDLVKKETHSDSAAAKINKPSDDDAIKNNNSGKKVIPQSDNTIVDRSVTPNKKTVDITQKDNNILTDEEKILPGTKQKKYNKIGKQKINSQPKNFATGKNKIKEPAINDFAEETPIPQTNADRKLMILPVERMAFPKMDMANITVPTIKTNALWDSLLTASVVAINKKKSAKNFKPYWTFTPFASNDWAQYQLDNDVPETTGINHNEKEEIYKREKHESGFSAGVFGSLQITKRFGIKTGLIFSKILIGIAPQEIYAAKEPNGTVAYKYVTSSGYGYIKPGFGLSPAVGDSIRTMEAEHNLQFITIPLQVTYKFTKKNFSVIPAVGIGINLITHAKIHTEVTDALNREMVTITGLNGMQNFYLGFMADVNLQYNYNNRLSFNLFPAFKYAITPITKSNVVKTYPYSFGIGAGISYKF